MINLEENVEFKSVEKDLENDLLSHKYNLYQQFFIIGINPKMLHLLNKINIKEIPKILFSPTIISKYPNNNLSYLNIPDSIIISHCFPNGFKNSIIESDEKTIKEKINYSFDFIFTLDNYQMNKNASIRINKVYYTCYVFYEKLDDYITCLDLKNNSNINNNLKRNILIPKAICLSSFCPYYEQSKLILHYLKNYVDIFNYNYYKDNKLLSNNNGNNLPIEKIIEGLIYNLPGLPRTNYIMKISTNNFSINDELHKQKNLNEGIKEIIFENSSANKKLKPIINYTLLMKFFKIEEIFEIIKLILLEEPILFFSKNIEHLTYTIEGLLSLIYPFEYNYPVVSVLPEQNYSFINIYKSFIFGINYTYSEDIFTLKGINLEDQKLINIITIENRFNNIINSNEKEKSKNPAIFNIKPNNSKFLQISEKSINNSITEIKELYLRRKSMIGMNKEEEKIDDRNEIEKKIKLPGHYFSKCCKKIENNLETKFKELKIKYKEQEKDKNIYNNIIELEKEKIFNDEITEIFLYFFTSIFLHYQEYCAKYQYAYDSNYNEAVSKIKAGKGGYYFRDKELEKKYYTNKLCINDLFNCDLFIDEMPYLDKPFYTKFLKTKIFFNFMKKKIFPLSIQDKLDILFFDDKVNEKLSRESGNKKIDTKFLEYNFNNNIIGEIEIKSLSKSFTDNFKQYFIDSKNKEKALNYFQYIEYKNTNNNNKDNIENYNSINDNNELKFSFYYYVFPKLLNDGIFYKDYKKEDESNSKYSPTNFTYKNSDCLYNQFEKEGNNIINDENMIKNYNNYYYTFNPISSYTRPYCDYVKILFLQYFSKIFHQIPYSKKNYYFNYLMLFMTNNKGILDQNSIMMMFNTITKYGDKSMAQYFFQFIKNKKYSIFLILREKLSPYKNYEQFDYSEIKNNIDDYDENFIENLNLYNKKGRSLSGYNSSKIRLSDKIYYKERKLSSSMDDNENNEEISDYNINNNDKLNKKEKNLQINNKFNFKINYFCTQKNEGNICNYPFDLNIDKIFKKNKKYIEFKCLKCEQIQELTITCKINEENNKNYNIKTKLYSPLTLLENDWFKNSNELNLNTIIENHLDEYICSLFYFYDQGLLCDFLIPEIIIKKNLKIENITNSFKIESNGKNIKINRSKINNKDNNKTYIPRNSNIFDISDKANTFFEFKSNIKKPASLIPQTIKKKNNPQKKAVGFTIKNKKGGAHKKNSISYSDFLNK